MHYESVIPKWENKYLNSLLGYFNLGDAEKEFPKNDYPRGSNMSFRMSVFSKIGNFNVDLGRKGNNLAGSEEKDIFKRIYQYSEYKVMYIPNAIVYHYVPIERTTTEFIKKQALGTGKGEKIRVRSEGKISTFKRYLVEWLKWNASFILFFLFLIKGKPAKGTMIIKFRWWVSMGLIKNTNL